MVWDRVQQSSRVVGLLAGWLLGCVLSACDDNGDEQAPRAAAPADHGPDQPELDAAADAAPRDAESSDAADVPVQDGPRAPVNLGLVPVPSAGPDELVSPVEQTMAHLETIAAGSRAVSIVRRWDELFSAPTEPRPEAWNELQSAASLYADAGRRVLVSLAIVDRHSDARPVGSPADWSDSGLRQAAEQLIDRTLATFGEELEYLSIGREVDRFLQTADSSVGSELVELISHLLSYSRDHGQLPAATRVGVSASWQGLTAGSAELEQLLGASDVVIATYYPLESDFTVREPVAAAGDLQALVDSRVVDAGPAQLVLQEVGYPSAEQTGSSERTQQRFYQSFFQALQSRRDHFPFVSVYALNDPPVGVCEADAEASGAEHDEVAVAAWCSMGLRDSDAAPKVAWETLADALATFSVP
jgi:hypothetical protein